MSRKFRVAPVGTCRIHTPLRIGANKHPFALELEGNYGFVHTTAEILQQLDAIIGSKPVPEAVRPLVYRPSGPISCLSTSRGMADLYFVEVSSRRLVTLNGHPIQSNYTIRHFSNFFADRNRSAAYWQFADARQHKARRDMLRNDAAFRALSEEDQKMLLAIERHEQDDAEIEQGIARIAETIGHDRIVFVTHVDANTPDNTLIDNRHKLIQLIRRTCRKLNLTCYDPTPLMREVGQIKAMENAGLDLTHYSESFSVRLSDDWFRRLIAPRIAVQEGAADIQFEIEQDDDHDVNRLETLWRNGQLAEASRRVRRLLRVDPLLCEHQKLLGNIQFELGDYEGAIASFEVAREELGTSEQIDLALMQSHFEVGDYRRAREYAVALLSDERETPEILRVAATSSARLGDFSGALTDWRRLFRIAPDKREAASAVLEILRERKDEESAAQWAADVLDILPAHYPSFRYLWDSHVAAHDQAALVALAEKPVDLSLEQAASLARVANDAGHATPAALLAARHGLHKLADRAVGAWIEICAGEWLEQGLAALAAGDYGAAADKLQARWLVRPSSLQLIRARRQLEQSLRRETRQRFIANDHQGVVELVGLAQKAQFQFPEMDSFIGRSAHALGDYRRALDHLKLAAADADAPAPALVQLGRTAARADYFHEAIDAYDRVRQIEAEDTAPGREARAQLPKLTVRAVRAARQRLRDGDADGAWTLVRKVLSIDAENEHALRERSRIMASYRTRLNRIAVGDSAERQALGEAILELAPEDEAGLRAAAIGAMRQHRFREALGYWQRLRPLIQDPAQIDINIRKCELWIERESNRLAA